MVDSHETHDVYPNLSENSLSTAPLNIPLNDQEHFRLNKINEVKIILLLKLKKDN